MRLMVPHLCSLMEVGSDLLGDRIDLLKGQIGQAMTRGRKRIKISAFAHMQSAKMKAGLEIVSHALIVVLDHGAGIGRFRYAIAK